MKTLTRVAFAAALIAGSSSIALAPPAFAKKKEDKPAAGGLKLSKELLEPAGKIDAAAKAREAAPAAGKAAADAAYVAVLETSVPAMETAAKTDDDRYVAQVYRFQLDALKLAPGASEAGLVTSLDPLLANPKTPKESIARYAFVRGNIAFNAKQYPVAMANYTKARDAGNANTDIPLLIAKSKVLSGDVNGGVADIEAAIAADKAAGRPVPEDMYTYAITALQKTGDNAATQRWTRNWLHAYGTPKNWRTAIYVFGFQGAGAKRIDKRQRVDLFRLMRTANGLAGQADYLEYAELAVSIGLGSEAVSVIEEGQGNKKIASPNADATRFMAEAKAQIALEGTLAAQERKAAAAINGALAADTGDFCLGNKNYAKAIEMYRLALSKGGVNAKGAPAIDPDEVNTHLGIALAATGDKAGAKAAFAAVKAAPRTEIATLWTTWIEAPAGGAAAAPAM